MMKLSFVLLVVWFVAVMVHGLYRAAQDDQAP